MYVVLIKFRSWTKAVYVVTHKMSNDVQFTVPRIVKIKHGKSNFRITSSEFVSTITKLPVSFIESSFIV